MTGFEILRIAATSVVITYVIALVVALVARHDLGLYERWNVTANIEHAMSRVIYVQILGFFLWWLWA